jgi:CRP-like cAMP-binding protein
MTLLRRPDPVAATLEGLGIAKAAAARLSRSGTLLDLDAGSTLCEEGERGTQAFLILEGTADVLTAGGVVTVGPGDVVGEQATLDPRRTRNATVVAHTPLVVLVFDVRTYRAIAEDVALRDRLVPQRTAA